MSILFLIVALTYSAAGLGGGSSYIALLALFDYPYEVVPVIALSCNLIVVSSSAFHFYRQGHFRWYLYWPFALFSIPMAFIGGQINIDKELFLLLLGLCLFVVAIRLIFVDTLLEVKSGYKQPNMFLAIIIGSGLGLLAGLTGIGGGIYLSPILLYLRWGLPKQVAATSAFFILLNSLSGLGGQLFKNPGTIELFSYWPLFLSVLIGGMIGSSMGSTSVLSQRNIKNLTALLVLFVSLRILWRFI